MTRMILIVGTGRSGTSALAGALHEMGAPFCGHLVGAHPDHNPLGHYECRQWWEVGRTNGDYTQLVRTHRQAPLWAVKDTWARPQLLDVLEPNSRVIAMHRQFGAAVDSRLHHSAVDRITAANEQVARQARLFSLLDDCPAPVLHVDYERLVGDTLATLTAVRAFVYEGLGMPSDACLKAAARFVKPSLNHHSLTDLAGEEAYFVADEIEKHWGFRPPLSYAGALSKFVSEVA